MMTVVVAEGRRDIEFLKRALAAHAGLHGLSMDAVRFSTADAGRAGVGKIARHLLRETPHRLAVIFDADTDDQVAADDRARYMRDELSRIAPPERFHLTVVQPEFEVLLFDGGALEAQLFGEPLGEEERALARFAPRQFVRFRKPALLEGEVPRDVDWSLLAAHPALGTMLDFVFAPQAQQLAATGT